VTAAVARERADAEADDKSGTGENGNRTDAARAAGAAPIRVDQPGYRKGLDRDGDGTACDN
jgi:hypothetical protein